MVADILNHFPQKGQIIGQFSFMNIPPNQVAKDSSEVLVSGKGKKTAAICKHTDESGKESHIRKRT